MAQGLIGINNINNDFSILLVKDEKVLSFIKIIKALCLS